MTFRHQYKTIVALVREVFQHTTRGDRVLLTAVFFMLPFSYVYYWHTPLNTQGTQVEISVAGNVVQTLELTHNGQYSIAGTLGNSLIEIKDHKARFLASPCMGKQCLHMGWQSLSGAFAACLPNRMTLSIKGQSPQWDSLTF